MPAWPSPRRRPPSAGVGERGSLPPRAGAGTGRSGTGGLPSRPRGRDRPPNGPAWSRGRAGARRESSIRVKRCRLSPGPPGPRGPDRRRSRNQARCPRRPVSIELFGGFALRLDGIELELSAIKPRARLVLHLLGLAGGAPVHREVLLAALWPETEPETAARLLHVAISSLRTVLEPGTPRGGAGLIRREGDAYRLGPAAGLEIDLVDLRGASRLGGGEPGGRR